MEQDDGRYAPAAPVIHPVMQEGYREDADDEIQGIYNIVVQHRIMVVAVDEEQRPVPYVPDRGEDQSRDKQAPPLFSQAVHAVASPAHLFKCRRQDNHDPYNDGGPAHGEKVRRKIKLRGGTSEKKRYSRGKQRRQRHQQQKKKQVRGLYQFQVGKPVEEVLFQVGVFRAEDHEQGNRAGYKYGETQESEFIRCCGFAVAEIGR